MALISWEWLHFGVSDVQFAKMILRDRCSTSYDLASIFPGRRSTLDRWTGKIAKRIGTRLSALHSTFHFWRTSRRILRFWCLALRKMRNSCRIASFRMLSSSKNEDVSQNCSVLDDLMFEHDGRVHFEVKMCKTHHGRTTFGSWDVEKVHAVVARSTFPSQNVQNTTCSRRFWRFRCRCAWQAHRIVHLFKSEHNVIVLWHFQNRWQAWDIWRESAKMHFPWQAQYKRHVHERC